MLHDGDVPGWNVEHYTALIVALALVALWAISSGLTKVSVGGVSVGVS